MQLSTYIHQTYDSFHEITITMHKNILCDIHLQFLYVRFYPITAINLLK